MSGRGTRWAHGTIAAAAVLAAGLLLASCGGSSQSEADCGNPEAMLPLTPSGTGAAAFTMGIRVQRPADVDNLDAGIRDRVLPRDVFVVDTEHPNSDAKEWQATLQRVSERFPCNRVMALAGLSPTPNRPSYEFALVGHPGLDGILVDWESLSWNGTGRGSWTPAPAANLVRIRAHMAQLVARLKGTQTRVGLAPQYLPPWDYGRTAAVVAAANFTLDPLHRGYQVIQTQDNCGRPRAPGPPIPGLTSRLISQYKAVFGRPLPLPRGNGPLLTQELLQHLGFEIAFTTTPNPKASEAEERIGPQQAAACTDQIVKAGGAGIAYWASPASLRAMLDTPVGRRLRPASAE
jgi:hypothetical protein